MEPKRLILVPQLPISMRYQSWWHNEIEREMKNHFEEVVVLGAREPVDVDSSQQFSARDQSLQNEFQQMQEYLALGDMKDSILFQCDLSYPGLFHTALFHARPRLSATFCHATALNRFDIFHRSRTTKWRVERSFAELYTTVMVSTEYHRLKIGLKNSISLGALPNTPKRLLPKPSGEKRKITFCSTTRPCCQKVDRTVEAAVRKASGKRINRHEFKTWEAYYQYLDRCKFLLITTKEETYGLASYDAWLRGCIPIMPRAFSFPELWPDELLYDNDAKPDEKAKQIMGIAEKMEGVKIQPKNEDAIRDFYSNLARVLKHGK